MGYVRLALAKKKDPLPAAKGEGQGIGSSRQMLWLRLAEGNPRFSRAAVWKGRGGGRLGQFGDLPWDVEGSGTTHGC